MVERKQSIKKGKVELLTVLYLNQENAPEGTKKSQIHREGTLMPGPGAGGWEEGMRT